MEEHKAKRVREMAMKLYGHSKGSISKAVNNALDEWLKKADTKKKKLTVDHIFGIAKGAKITSSVQAQKDAVAHMGRYD